MHKIVMLGPPGSGKGTQAKFLTKELNIPTISTGEIFRAEVKAGSKLGKKIKERMNAGELVGVEVVNEIVKKRLGQPDVASGFILDGYPRTMLQVDYLEKLIDMTLALNIDSSDEIVTKRVAARRTCQKCGVNFNILFKPPAKENVCDKCGGELYVRADAKPEAIKERLTIYHSLIDPILEYYKDKGILININGEPSIEEVWQEVKKKLSI